MNSYQRALLAVSMMVALQACDSNTAHKTDTASSYAQLKTLTLDTQKTRGYGRNAAGG